MARNFLTITQADIDLKLAESLKSREQELMSYDFEAETHQKIIDSLAAIDWDDTTKPYKGLTRDMMISRALADGLDADKIQQISELLTKDSHQKELLAVRVETAKSERQYDNILAQLPEGERRDSALAKLTADEVEK